MSETAVFYRGPSGTTIDAAALENELAAASMALRTERDDEFTVGRPVAHSDLTRIFDRSDDQCHAVVLRLLSGEPIITVDEETFTASERVEGLARLLRRVLPEPAKVVSYMSDDQWANFQGTGATYDPDSGLWWGPAIPIPAEHVQHVLDSTTPQR